MTATPSQLPVIVAGGGIGGLAAALALVRQGFRVMVLEQAPQIGEIGAGIQIGPNGFHAFDALGVGDKARGRAVYTDFMVMHDALDEYSAIMIGFVLPLTIVTLVAMLIREQKQRDASNERTIS